MIPSGGANAANNGNRWQDVILNIFLARQYQRSMATSLDGLSYTRQTLFPVPGQIASQCQVPLVAPWHKSDAKFFAIVDFLVLTKSNDILALSVKSQQIQGTADEKLEFEIQQLVSTQLPSAMIIVGDGFREHILKQIWERARYFGSGNILLFRKLESIIGWLEDGCPVGSQGKRFSEVFDRYCDKTP